MRVGLSLGEKSLGFGLGLREVLIGCLLGKREHLDGLRVVLVGHARATAAYRRLLRGLRRLSGLLLGLLGGDLRLL